MLGSRFLPAALVAALMTAPMYADDPKPPIPATEKLELQQKEMLQRLRDLQSDVAALKARLDNADNQRSAWADSMEMKLKLEEVHADVLRLRAELGAANRDRSSSSSSPMPRGDDPTRIRPPGVPERVEAMRPALFGTVRLINSFAFTQRMQVNGVTYLLQSGEELDVPVPAGAGSYRLIGTHAVPVPINVPGGSVKQIEIY